MNWNIKGKHGKRPGGLRIISGPETEVEVRESVAASHPDFVIDSITPMTAVIKVAEAVAAEENEAVSKKAK